MTEILALGLMRRALAAGILVSAVCAALSPFVVLRRMSFVGHGLAHAAFGGVALGVLLGVAPTASGVVFSIAVALLIGVVGGAAASRRTLRSGSSSLRRWPSASSVSA